MLGDEITQGPPKAPEFAGIPMMNIALTDDLQRLLRKKVENGQFPNEEAFIEQALRLLLIGHFPTKVRKVPRCWPSVSRLDLRPPCFAIVRL
jgi:hypothetical protein